MKAARAVRTELERKDEPFDAHGAAMEAGSPSPAHAATKARGAARETGLRKGFSEVPEKEAPARPPGPVPRRHGFGRDLPPPFDDARRAGPCADMPARARSMRAEAAEKEAGGSAAEVAPKAGRACAAARDGRQERRPATEEGRCPPCGGKPDTTDATDRGRSVRGDALARIACVGCGPSPAAPAEAFDGARRALSGRGDRMTVQSVRRESPTGEVGGDGRPVVQQQATVTTDGIATEALVDLDKVAERRPGRSPPGLSEDALPLAVAKRPNAD